MVAQYHIRRRRQKSNKIVACTVDCLREAIEAGLDEGMAGNDVVPVVLGHVGVADAHGVQSHHAHQAMQVVRLHRARIPTRSEEGRRVPQQ